MGRTHYVSRRGLSGAITLLLSIAPLYPSSTPLYGKVVEKEGEKAKKLAPRPAAQPPGVRDPKADGVQGDEDARRLEALRMRLVEWSQPQVTTSKKGLSVQGFVVPDAIAYRVGTAYLDNRQNGADHATAVANVALSLASWKRYENKVLVRVDMENPKFRARKNDRCIYTLERNLRREGIILRLLPETTISSGGGSNRESSRLRYSLAGMPAGLRLTQLRKKKFWVTSDGKTYRGIEDGLDPAAIGREPLLSKPFLALVLEDQTVELELLVKRKRLTKSGRVRFELGFHHWKCYEGPFLDDTLDLNKNRPWHPVTDLSLTVSLPPTGMRVPDELRTLVDEAKAQAESGK